MILSTLSVKRPVLAMVVSLLLVVFGVIGLSRMAVREYPDTDAPGVSISTMYPGASAEVVEREITEVIEESLSGIDGIDLIVSNVSEQMGFTGIAFDLDRDIDAAAADVRDRVAQVVSRLPDDALEPIVSKIDSDAAPILFYNVRSKVRDRIELSDFVDRVLVDPLSVLPGVAQVDATGSRKPAMRIWLDRREMASRNVTASDIIRMLREENVELPAGRVESRRQEISVRTTTRLRTAEEFRKLVVREDGDYLIRLGEVARIEIGPEDLRSELLEDGVPNIGIGIIPQSNANTIDVVQRVHDAIEGLRPLIPPDIDVHIALDQTLFVQESMAGVILTLGIAAIVVVLVIYMFLGSMRETLIPAVAIPVSLVAAFSVLSLLGYSINTLTLLAVLLAIGLVVDDAIVMLENIHRRRELGEPRLLAALYGADQVGFAIIATTLVLVSVFLPLALVGGNTGRLFTEFGVAMASAVAFSSLIALTLAPMLASKLPDKAHGDDGKGGTDRSHWFDGVVGAYTRVLDMAFARPFVVIGISGVMALSAGGLFMALPQELTPYQDRGTIIIPSIGPEGANLAYMYDQMEIIRKKVVEPRTGGDGPIVRTIQVMGSGGPFARPVNSGMAFLVLKDWGERDIDQKELSVEINKELMGIPGILAFAINPKGLGAGNQMAPVAFVVSGADRETVHGWGQTLFEHARSIPGLLNVQTNYKNTKPELSIEIDRIKAADLGLSVRQIGETLQVLLGGMDVTRYSDRGREYDVILQANPEDREAPDDLSHIFVRSQRTGKSVPLSSVVTTSERGVSSTLFRKDRLPAVTINASLAPNMALGEALDRLEDVAAEVLPPEAKISYFGQSREFKKSTGAAYAIFGLALLIVFLVLAAQFESFVHPLTIMVSVPIAVTGGLAGLWLTGMSFNIYGQIGLVLLIGLMAKNGILIVEFANQLRDEGYEVHAAIREACQIRLRPVVMTSLATIFGVAPLLIGGSAGSESRIAVGTVVIGGMTLATFMTLFIVPVLYLLLGRYTKPSGTIERMIHELEVRERSTARGDAPAE